jgi:hypothetical protein
MLDRPPSRDPTRAARKRRFRERQKHGLIYLPINVPHYRFVAALIASGYLSETEALDAQKLAKAAEQVIADYIQCWERRSLPAVDICAHPARP